ncbi:AAA family ATPase [Demequina sp. NBRC 110056]|uniref:AAA family ATPase n=1 Tax=Demequina sp. NBRC 110056 TaxID=1570345 RepID=UPI000A02884B|nr:helix-turn-helix transcriptional regulator [Demequina sp. NBRC 110056]
MRWELVGRHAELARLQALLASSPVTVLHGDAGVGKSRLLAEAVRHHARSGGSVFHTLATSATQDVPLSPFVGLLAQAPPSDPSLLMATLATAARARGGDRGLLIAIDDAHHLDPTSVGFLAVATSTSGTRIIMTVRDDADVPPPLTETLRQDIVARVRVEPLRRDETAALADQMVAGLPVDVVEDVWSLTEGNPLMVRELLADGTFAGSPTEPVARDAALPALARLRALARERLAAFPPELSDAMELLAVGAPVPHPVLEHATSRATVDALLARHAAQVDAQGDAEVLMPAHPLYGDVLRDGIDADRRRALCHRLVRAAAATGASVDPLRAALWQDEAAQRMDVDVAVSGVEAALFRQDGALAERLLTTVADRIERSRRALLRGLALMQQRRFVEAEAAFAEIEPAAVDAPVAGNVASARAFNLAFGLQDPAAADAVLSAGQERTAGGPIAARLESERGVIAAMGGDLEPAIAAARRTLELPQADHATLASAYVSLTVAEAMRGTCSSMEEDVEQGLTYAKRAGPAMPFARDQLEITLTQSLLFDGRCEEASVRCADASADPSRAQMRWLWQVFATVVACTRGRAEDAGRASADAIARRASAALLDIEGSVLGADAMARALAGDVRDLHGVEEAWARRGDVRNRHWIDRGRVWMAAARGDVRLASEIAVEAGHRTLQRQHRSWAIDALHDAVRLWTPTAPHGSVDLAEVASSMALARDGTSAVRLLDIMTDHARATAARDAGQLEHVAHRFAACGAHLFAIETQAQAAMLLEHLGDQTASARAAVQSAAWQRACQPMRTPAIEARPSPGVSERVLDVAIAAAAGTSSAEIAQDMFLSVRTVDNHLGSAYRAWEVSGRRELAALLGGATASAEPGASRP